MKAIRLTTTHPDGRKTVKVFDLPSDKALDTFGGTGINGQAIRELKKTGRYEVDMETGRTILYEVVK